MKLLFKAFSLLFIVFMALPQTVYSQDIPKKPDIWITAYLASYNHYAPPGGNWGNLPTDEIDWSAFTHLNYFALSAQSDGSISDIAEYKNMNPTRINAIVEAGHQADTPVLITIGGWGNHEGFSGAIQPSSREIFIQNLMNLVTDWGFDGIDLDMEPIKDSDVENYKAFVKQLHDSLQTLSTPLLESPLLTAATGDQPEMFADLSENFDQINLMTYDMSGAWPGWVVWHNSPIYNGGNTFPDLNQSLPSANREIDKFQNAGVPLQKLGMGIDFYGYVWEGVSEPLQTWLTQPEVKENVPYHEIMNEYYQESHYNWDSTASVSYLSINNLTESKFVSYDDVKTSREKIKYVRQKGIGGAIIWELSGGHMQNKPDDNRDPLLDAIKDQAWGDYTSNPETRQTPDDFKLEPNYPNPFNPLTKIKFSIPQNTHVSLSVYNLLGQRVEKLVDRRLSAGTYSVKWKASQYSSGTYLYRLKTEYFTKTKKMTLSK